MFTIADKRKDRADALTPPVWKTMIASGLAIYPLILFVPSAIEPYTRRLAEPVAALVQVGILTPISTLVMIPLVTWALKQWLYRLPPAPGASGT